jgi:hypothetical protein
MALFFAHSDHDPGSLGRAGGSQEPEMAMDLLVDDELPEDRRRELLKAIEQMPGGWRALSLHFLSRQVERRAVREVLSGGQAGRKATLYRIDWVRVAAMVMITAGLFGAAGLYLGRGGITPTHPMATGGGSTQVASTQSPQVKNGTIQYITPGLPPGFGTQLPETGGTPTFNASNVRTTAYSEANHIVLVPEGPGNVMAYPVVPVNGKQQTIY